MQSDFTTTLAYPAPNYMNTPLSVIMLVFSEKRGPQYTNYWKINTPKMAVHYVAPLFCSTNHQQQTQ